MYYIYVKLIPGDHLDIFPAERLTQRVDESGGSFAFFSQKK